MTSPLSWARLAGLCCHSVNCVAGRNLRIDVNGVDF
jgi:hypothetical protein